MADLRAFGGPGRYLQGPGALDVLGEIVTPFGRPLVITDPSVYALLGSRLHSTLAGAGLRPVFGLLDGEITYAAVDRLAGGHAEDAVEVLVGVGGGKVLDAAKGVALRLGRPVITVPTIASNDSPASGAIAMYDDAHTLISVDRLPQHPAAVIVDTELISRAPVAFLRSGIGDAIAKKFEAEGCWAGTGTTPLGTRPLLTAGAIADACYRTLRRHAVGAVQTCLDQIVSPDLEAVVEAVVLMSGLGFENGGLSLAHAMTRGLMQARGASTQMHGLQVAWGLLVQLAVLRRQPPEIAELMNFYRELELPTSLAALGLADPSAAEIEQLVALSLTAPHIRNLPERIDSATVIAAIATVERLAAERPSRPAQTLGPPSGSHP
jgi:glycerol dehydrogenase